MSRLVHHLWCHPVRGPLHGLKDLRLPHTQVDTEPLGTTEVYQLDHTIWHQHHITSLNIPGKCVFSF